MPTRSGHANLYTLEMTHTAGSVTLYRSYNRSQVCAPTSGFGVCSALLITQGGHAVASEMADKLRPGFVVCL